uniref:Uncharacterized protein n=1 Tax=Anguilla anguilla TaxID=7936 RepID=A0A0E9V2M7_ANGAN
MKLCFNMSLRSEKSRKEALPISPPAVLLLRSAQLTIAIIKLTTTASGPNL